MRGCGTNSSPHMFSASSSSAACGPFETMKRCGVAREHIHESLHEIDVGRAEAAEREVDERAVAFGDVSGQLGGRVECVDDVRPCACGRERPAALVVHFLGVEVEVQPLRLVDELARRAVPARRAPRRRRRTGSAVRPSRVRTRRGTLPNPCGRLPGSPRRPAGYPDPSARGGYTRRSAPRGARRCVWQGSRPRCPPRSRWAGPRRRSPAAGRPRSARRRRARARSAR